MENDYSKELESSIYEENQIDEENTPDFTAKKESSAKRASKRPIQRSKEPLDIEPVEEKNLVIDSKQSESAEIDDPW